MGRFPEDIIRTYIRAKDENRPHLMENVFAENCLLEMAVKTGTISFPALTKGLHDITDVLVRNFNQTYENIYTFCLRRPSGPADGFSCDWLVVMSEKKGWNVRVGYGGYEWRFQAASPHLVEALKVTIDVMQSLSPETGRPVFGWAAGLPYPWCSSDIAAQSIPRIPELTPLLSRLGNPRAG